MLKFEINSENETVPSPGIFNLETNHFDPASMSSAIITYRPKIIASIFQYDCCPSIPISTCRGNLSF